MSDIKRIITLLEAAEAMLLKADIAVHNADMPPRWRKRIHALALEARRVHLASFELLSPTRSKKKKK